MENNHLLDCNSVSFYQSVKEGVGSQVSISMVAYTTIVQKIHVLDGARHEHLQQCPPSVPVTQHPLKVKVLSPGMMGSYVRLQEGGKSRERGCALNKR